MYKNQQHKLTEAMDKFRLTNPDLADANIAERGEGILVNTPFRALTKGTKQQEAVTEGSAEKGSKDHWALVQKSIAANDYEGAEKHYQNFSTSKNREKVADQAAAAHKQHFVNMQKAIQAKAPDEEIQKHYDRWSAGGLPKSPYESSDPVKADEPSLSQSPGNLNKRAAAHGQLQVDCEKSCGKKKEPDGKTQTEVRRMKADSNNEHYQLGFKHGKSGIGRDPSYSSQSKLNNFQYMQGYSKGSGNEHSGWAEPEPQPPPVKKNRPTARRIESACPSCMGGDSLKPLTNCKVCKGKGVCEPPAPDKSPKHATYPQASTKHSTMWNQGEPTGWDKVKESVNEGFTYVHSKKSGKAVGAVVRSSNKGKFAIHHFASNRQSGFIYPTQRRAFDALLKHHGNHTTGGKVPITKPKVKKDSKAEK